MIALAVNVSISITKMELEAMLIIITHFMTHNGSNRTQK